MDDGAFFLEDYELFRNIGGGSRSPFLPVSRARLLLTGAFFRNIWGAGVLAFSPVGFTSNLLPGVGLGMGTSTTLQESELSH